MQTNKLFILCFILFSCNQNKKPADGFLTTESNFSYKIISSENGNDSIQKGDIVKVHLMQFIDDSLMNDTRTGMPEYIKIDSTLRKFDFSEILPLMKVNDSAICLFSTKEIIKRSTADIHPPHFLEEGKFIKVYLKITDRFTTDSLGLVNYAIEKAKFDNRVLLKEKTGYEQAANDFNHLINSAVKPMQKLPDGVYVQILKKGTGGKIKQYDSVAVVYKGMLANGTVFEKTTKEQPYVLRAGGGESVQGFDSGIASLNFGDKAMIFIPARLAYGANKAGENIPAFANLVFEVEVYKK